MRNPTHVLSRSRILSAVSDYRFEPGSNGSIPLVNLNCGDLDSNIASGADDALLTADAEACKSYGEPVLFRWFWEMNLKNVTRYNACLGSTDQAALYVAAFQHIWTVFHDVGATNVAFVWAPSCAIHAPNAAASYPGPSYVDWVGCDIYDRSGTVPFATAYAPAYQAYSGFGVPGDGEHAVLHGDGVSRSTSRRRSEPPAARASGLGGSLPG